MSHVTRLVIKGLDPEAKRIRHAYLAGYCMGSKRGVLESTWLRLCIDHSKIANFKPSMTLALKRLAKLTE